MIISYLTRNIYEYCSLANISSKKLSPQLKVIPFCFLPFFIKYKQHKSSIDDVIKQADALFEESKFSDVYNLLQQYQYDNAQIQWRKSRALFKMSQNQNDKTEEIELINEAYNVISKCLKENSNVAEVYKWSAVLYDQKLRTEKRMPSVSDTLKVKEHLLEAHKRNPNDYAVLYLLGTWCYNISSLTWLQRKISKLIFWDPPTSSYEEALDYFLRAEELKPRFYVSNLYMLGKINYEMGNMYRAHYYLKIAAEMIATTDQEQEYMLMANKLLKKLKDYDIVEEAL